MDNWKLGIFYYNPADPRISVPKAHGIGYTLNFAHPVSWVIMAAILALIVFAIARRYRAGK